MADAAILKEAAAQRQIDAAIRMLFLHGEDLLAIHGVAAAARNILKDLAKKRGVSYAHRSRQVLENFYQIEYGFDTSDPVVAAQIDLEAKGIEKVAWDFRTKGENFLKHADKDPRGHLSSADLNTLWVIAEAIWFWDDLNLTRTDEMFIYHLWLKGVTAEDYPENIVNTKSGPIHLLTFKQQIDFGRYGLKLMYKKRLRSSKQFRDDSVGPLIWTITPIAGRRVGAPAVTDA